MNNRATASSASTSTLSTNIFELIDCDQLVSIVLKDVLSAVKGWFAGRPTDEIALLNRLTEKYANSRPRCDLGLAMPVHVDTLVYELHRKGPNQSDLFGSDLAITVSANDIGYRKTAFIQIKKAKRFKATIQKRQIELSARNSWIHDNSFVMAANQERISVRVKSVKDLLSSFTSQHTMTVDIVTWRPLSEFLLRWLICEFGTPSDRRAPASIEQTLSNYIVETDIDHGIQLPWGTDPQALLREGEEELLPRSWIIVVIRVRKNEGESPQLELLDTEQPS